MTPGTQTIDLRSDTVTHPTPEMYAAMAAAPLGDDVYGGDPTVEKLQNIAADLLGKEAALFFPSGTQSNLAAMLSHCGRGEEIIAGRDYHVFQHEAGGSSALGGIVHCAIPNAADGRVSPADIRAAIKADDPHYPITRLISLENTVSGRVIPHSDRAELVAIAQEHGLSIHLDGARIMNAAAATGLAPSVLAEGADSVSVCLSKGLGTPSGTVLCGSTAFIKRAYRARKLLGGAMRQVGILAACGIVALEQNRHRLGEDHANARRLGEGLAAIDGLSVDLDRVETNMVFVEPRTEDHSALRKHMREGGILFGGQDKAIRLVTHHDISPSDVDRVVERAEGFFR